MFYSLRKRAWFIGEDFCSRSNMERGVEGVNGVKESHTQLGFF
jgi:hypothetical protein